MSSYWLNLITQIHRDYLSKKWKLPPKCIYIFLSTPTLELFGMKIDDTIRTIQPTGLIAREDLIADLTARAVIPDLSVVKNEIKKLRRETDFISI